MAGSTPLSEHWGNILQVFDSLLATLKSCNVPSFLVRKLFQQLFSFVNVQLFNQLLLRRECCSFSNGEYVKTGLGEVEQWIHSAGQQWVGESWEQLKYIRQVCRLPHYHPYHHLLVPQSARTPLQSLAIWALSQHMDASCEIHAAGRARLLEPLLDKEVGAFDPSSLKGVL